MESKNKTTRMLALEEYVLGEGWFEQNRTETSVIKSECECCIGMLFDYENTDLITREEFEDLIKSESCSYYTREQYCDREFSTDLIKFDFCPKCGKEIDWDAIRENR